MANGKPAGYGTCRRGDRTTKLAAASPPTADCATARLPRPLFTARPAIAKDFSAARRAPPGQTNVNQFRQLVAVTAFQDGADRNVELPQPFSERSEVFRLERHLRDRVAAVSVEAGRNQEEVRFESHQ